MEKIKIFIWLGILICFAYFVFLKPQPQRFTFKVIDKKEEERELSSTENEGFIVFDTATGKVFHIEATTQIFSQSNSIRTVESNLFLDPVHNVQVLRPVMKIKRLNGYETGNNTTTMKL